MNTKFKWLDTDEYPFNSKFITSGEYQQHYIDEGKGEIVLFIHGTPSWSFDYRNVIKKLRNHYRCIAIDHMGFGLSDKPSEYDYSTKAHSLRLENFILEMNLRDITLVVHDFGGPIGLNIAMNHPSRVKKLKEQYTSPFADNSERNGALAFAKSLLNDQDWFGELWDKKRSIESMPFLFLWGMKDPVLSPSYLDKFISGFKNNKVFKFDTCGHFPQEEHAMEVARAIEDFIS